MSPLIKLTLMCGQPLVKVLVKPYLNPCAPDYLPELLPRSPKFTLKLKNLPL
jgi:hypothetical protein